MNPFIENEERCKKKKKKEKYLKKNQIFQLRKLVKRQIKSRVSRRNKNQSRNQLIHKEINREYQLIPKDGSMKVTIKLINL